MPADTFDLDIDLDADPDAIGEELIVDGRQTLYTIPLDQHVWMDGFQWLSVMADSRRIPVGAEAVVRSGDTVVARGDVAETSRRPSETIVHAGP